MQNFFRIILLFGLLIGVIVFSQSAWAQQKPVQQPAPQQPAKQQGEDEPVAVTEKTKPPVTNPIRETTEEQFGNFRFPIINNKGEIAFLGLWVTPKTKKGYGQAVFIRSTDGKWKILREGEKAVNVPEPIHGFSIPNFNDKGDLTFTASFGEESSAPLKKPDPNDPAAGMVQPKNEGLFVRSADGMKRLVKLGEEVPNMPSYFSVISNPSTNSKGVSAFIGTYSDPDGRGLFMVEEGKLRLIVRSGQKTGPGETAVFSEHYYPSAINERNEVAFYVQVTEKSGIYVGRPGSVEAVATIGMATPIIGADFIGFGNRTPAINNKGDVAFAAFFNGPQYGRGLFVKSGGQTKLIARSGDTVPGSTALFTDFLNPAINTKGEVVFVGQYEGRGRGIFVKREKGIEALILYEQPVPGGEKGEIFNNFTQPSFNDRGEVVFYGQTRAPNTGMNVGVFMIDEKGTVRTIVKRGDQMPK